MQASIPITLLFFLCLFFGGGGGGDGGCCFCLRTAWRKRPHQQAALGINHQPASRHINLHPHRCGARWPSPACSHSMAAWQHGLQVSAASGCFPAHSSPQSATCRRTPYYYGMSILALRRPCNPPKLPSPTLLLLCRISVSRCSDGSRTPDGGSRWPSATVPTVYVGTAPRTGRDPHTPASPYNQASQEPNGNHWAAAAERWIWVSVSSLRPMFVRPGVHAFFFFFYLSRTPLSCRPDEQRRTTAPSCRLAHPPAGPASLTVCLCACLRTWTPYVCITHTRHAAVSPCLISPYLPASLTSSSALISLC